MNPLRRRTALAFALAWVPLSAGARPAPDPKPECPAIDVPAPAGRVRVFVDPATGKLRPPTPDELRQIAEERLKARRTAPARRFEVITSPDGMQSVDLGDAFLFDVRLETRPDGSTRIECVPHAAPAAEK